MGSNPMLEPHDQQESIEAKKPKITTVHSTDRTAVGTIINFTEGTYDLDEDGERKLRELLPKLLGLNYKIEIRGHTTRREQYLAGDSEDDWKTAMSVHSRSCNTCESLGLRNSDFVYARRADSNL